jgi:hypothetical protein
VTRGQAETLRLESFAEEGDIAGRHDDEPNLLNAGWAIFGFRSDGRDVLSLRFSGLAILSDFEADLVAFAERPAALQRRHVNKNVLPATLRGDEAEALVVIEEFNGTCRHEITISLCRSAICEGETIASGLLYQPFSTLAAF